MDQHKPQLPLNLICVICCELKKADYQMKAKRPVLTTLSWSLRCQVNRFTRSIISFEGLQGVREKLGNDGDRLHRQIVQYVAFSTRIVGRNGVREQNTVQRSRSLRTLLSVSPCLQGGGLRSGPLA